MLQISGESCAQILRLSPNCSFHIIDCNSDASGLRLTFNDFGGAKKVKEDIQELLIKPLKDASRLTFYDFGGAKKVKEDIQELLIKPLKEGRKAFSIILSGDTGCGKTLFLRIVQNYLGKKAMLLSKEEFEVLLENGIASDDNEELAILIDNFDYLLHCTEKLCRRTHGYTGNDLKAVCESVYSLYNVTDGDQSLLLKRFDKALKRIPPTGIRQFVLEVPDVKWDDIAGYDELKLEIEQAVLWPYQYPDVFERFAAKPPSGILLYGPPGCSKTMIARAIASQSRMNFLAVKGPELFSKWVGESERAIRELFRRARQVAPAIIFFDEIDAVAANRGDRSESHVGERVLTQLLTELDGLEWKGEVMVLAATNRPDRLDSALLRPGRLDLTIHVPLPDEETR
ncbi:unnamed protein product [Gongylonema pulchrum]|uniref:AAA domain-containing protein n=1 Tax=Gongylonema pulchrum TaxID=637853 RepID=A0A183E8G7_9BILA|nr:unnamed protein product [Gongylonema pulchrum]